LFKHVLFLFNRTLLFAGLDLTPLNYIAIPIGDASSSASQNFYIIYWIFFVIAFTPYIFVITVRIIIYFYTVVNGEASAAILVDKFQEKIHSVLWILVNTMYFPVIGTMIAGTDCTYYTDKITLDADPTVQCLTGEHIAYLVCSMIALIIYYPAASFAQAQTQSISDIKFKPRIVFVMLQGKFLLVALPIYITSKYLPYYIITMIINIIFIVLNVVGQPCLVPWVNRMRTVFFIMILWATLCGFGAYLFADQWNIIPGIILLVGWAVQLICIPLLFVLYTKFKRSQNTLP